MPERRRILLVRLDGVGDALACIPMLEGLRRAWPAASFGAVCSPANAGVFADDHVVTYVRSGDAGDLELSEEIRNAGYDATIVATEEVTGYALSRASGAAVRVGFWHRFEKPFKSLWQRVQLTHAVYRPAAWVREPEHEAVTLYRLASAIGAKADVPDDAVSLRRWIGADVAGAVPQGRITLGVQIAPKLALCGWDPAALAAMIAAALERSGYSRCALLAASADAGLARAVMEHMPPTRFATGCITVAPTAKLRAWLGAIASLGALVSPDTGAAHAAGMLGVPVVDIFEPERFEQLSRQWRPWAAPARCIVKPARRAGVEQEFGAEIGDAIAALSGPALGATT
jgi:ADP-heptose:LPS heptosyltransferase